MPFDFSKAQLKSLEAVVKLVKYHGRKAHMSDSIEDIAYVLNNFIKEDRNESKKV